MDIQPPTNKYGAFAFYLVAGALSLVLLPLYAIVGGLLAIPVAIFNAARGYEEERYVVAFVVLLVVGGIVAMVWR